MKRRAFMQAGLVLVSTTTAASVFKPANAGVFQGGELWKAKLTEPPKPVDISKRAYFTDKEYAQVAAIFDCLIPADELTPSASELGCVGFIDHQLAGAYGEAYANYQEGPFIAGTESQGTQTALTPKALYREGLIALEKDCQKRFNQSFEALKEEDQIHYLEEMEAGALMYPTLRNALSSAQAFFQQLLKDVREGFLSDPIYGGNKGMAAWRMIAFPGARYDYRDVVNIKGQQITLEPISILQRF